MRVQALAVIAALTFSVIPSAQAKHGGYYRDSARSVARHIGCTDFKQRDPARLNYDAGTCTLRDRRVFVFTFASIEQQRTWNDGVRESFTPQDWWANGEGAVVAAVAKAGRRKPAVLAARLLPGVVRRGTL